MWQLERHQIPALLLKDTTLEELYRTPEMACIQKIEILIKKSDMYKVYRLMRDMDYEGQEDRVGNGVIYTRVPGITVEFYNEIPIENKAFRKFFADPVWKYLRMEGYQWIHILTQEELYLYYVGKLVEQYMIGDLQIRDLLDFWLYQRTLNDDFPWKHVKSLLDKAKWQEFVSQVDLLSGLWFGGEEKEQYTTALELEEYILSHCPENERLDRELLPQEKFRLDFYRRNRKKEWAAKKLAWMFPSWEYMHHLFPVLDEHPKLLWWCWMCRYFRVIRKIMSGNMKKRWLRVTLRFSDFKEKIKSFFRKKEKNCEEEETEEKAVEATLETLVEDTETTTGMEMSVEAENDREELQKIIESCEEDVSTFDVKKKA